MSLLIVTVLGGVGLAALFAFTLTGVMFRPDEVEAVMDPATVSLGAGTL